jgi:hypothetical protein
VRAERDRKKKLIVAFHFVLANSQSRVAEYEGTIRAGWDCGSCRRHGLEGRRRCGFLPEEVRGEPRIVWGRKHAHSEECPKSLVTGASLALVEDFLVRRRLEIADSTDLEARKVDAFLILRDEMEREERDGTSQH